MIETGTSTRHLLYCEPTRGLTACTRLQDEILLKQFIVVSKLQLLLNDRILGLYQPVCRRPHPKKTIPFPFPFHCSHHHSFLSSPHTAFPLSHHFHFHYQQQFPFSSDPRSHSPPLPLRGRLSKLIRIHPTNNILLHSSGRSHFFIAADTTALTPSSNSLSYMCWEATSPLQSFRRGGTTPDGLQTTFCVVVGATSPVMVHEVNASLPGCLLRNSGV